MVYMRFFPAPAMLVLLDENMRARRLYTPAHAGVWCAALTATWTIIHFHLCGDVNGMWLVWRNGGSLDLGGGRMSVVLPAVGWTNFCSLLQPAGMAFCGMWPAWRSLILLAWRRRVILSAWEVPVQWEVLTSSAGEMACCGRGGGHSVDAAVNAGGDCLRLRAVLYGSWI